MITLNRELENIIKEGRYTLNCGVIATIADNSHLQIEANKSNITINVDFIYVSEACIVMKQTVIHLDTG